MSSLGDIKFSDMGSKELDEIVADLDLSTITKGNVNLGLGGCNIAHILARHGTAEQLQYVVDLGVDLTCKDGREGLSPFELFAESGNNDVEKVCIFMKHSPEEVKERALKISSASGCSFVRNLPLGNNVPPRRGGGGRGV